MAPPPILLGADPLCTKYSYCSNFNGIGILIHSYTSKFSIMLEYTSPVVHKVRKSFPYFYLNKQCRSQHGARGGNCPPQSWPLPPPPQSGLAPATVVSLRLAMGQLRLEKCIKTKKIQ